jgi:hypothetical protein
MRKKYNFFKIQNKLHWHIYRVLWGRIVYEKLPKIPLFGLSLIHRLRVLGSKKHPQTSFSNLFSTWRTENGLTEINLEGTGVINGCNSFLGQKFAKHLQLCGWSNYHATRKNLESRNPISGSEEL